MVELKPTPGSLIDEVAYLEKYDVDQRANRIYVDLVKNIKAKHARVKDKLLYSFSTWNDDDLTIRYVEFFDANYPDAKAVGVICWERDASGKFSIFSRLCESKRGPTFQSMSGIKSSKLEVVLSTVVKLFKPYKCAEIASTYLNTAKRFGATHVSASSLGDMHIPFHTAMEEMASLNRQGVLFATEMFRDLSVKVDLYKDILRKSRLNELYSYVMLLANGAVSVGVSDMELKRYSNVSEVPEELILKVNMLRMVNEGEDIPEVGYRAKDGVFWLWGVDARNIVLT